MSQRTGTGFLDFKDTAEGLKSDLGAGEGVTMIEGEV